MKEKRTPHEQGDVILLEFPGVKTTKIRPAVILSSKRYHTARPDIIIGLITSQVQRANSYTDHVLQDWSESGLAKPSAYRTFLTTVPRSAVRLTLGKLSDRDWRAVAQRLKVALGMS